jgi:hypothetical protein
MVVGPSSRPFPYIRWFRNSNKENRRKKIVTGPYPYRYFQWFKNDNTVRVDNGGRPFPQPTSSGSKTAIR